MIALWMIYATLVSLILLGAAHSLGTAVRPRASRTRWIWLGALVASWLIPAAALLLPGLRPVAARGSAIELGSLPSGVLPEPEATLPLLGRLTELLGGAEAFLDPWNGALLGLWGVLAAVGLLLLGVSAAAIGIRARRWPAATVLGERVRVAPTFGPALVGVMRPTVVLPIWVLGLDEAGQRLVLRHEVEHRRARDTLLLAAGALLTLAAPWNAALWWQLRRLRLAVEVDCDARVLGSGVSPRSYGTLLLGVGTRTERWAMPVAALAESRSFMERRLEMIASKRRGGWRSAVGVLAGGALIVIACEAPAPDAGVGITEVVEGVVADATPEAGIGNSVMARALFEHAQSVVRSQQETAAQDTSYSIRMTADDSIRIRVRPTDGVSGTEDAPLIVVDGVVQREVGEIDPADIASVSVLKGESAEALYGARGVNGVILITTKDGDGPEP
jgi:TonB-dependent SusC/RagA subfamily outer membrane receptor